MQPELFPEAVGRPQRDEKAILDIVFRNLAQAIEQWDPDGRALTDDEVDELMDTLEFDIDHGDGYDMARKLERLGYRPDARLVDILEMASFDVEAVFQHKEKEWVQATGVKPKLAVGQPITHQTPTEQHMAFIADIRYDTGHYLVSVPALGHTVERRQGFIRTWEEVEKEHEAQQANFLNTIFKK